MLGLRRESIPICGEYELADARLELFRDRTYQLVGYAGSLVATFVAGHEQAQGDINRALLAGGAALVAASWGKLFGMGARELQEDIASTAAYWKKFNEEDATY